MARKRDYKAEERRRNELARARGFKSRAAQRHAIETGKVKALAPSRMKNPRTVIAQQRLRAKERPSAFDIIYDTYSDEQRAAEWSSLFARHESGRFDYDGDTETAKSKQQFIAKYGKDAYVQAYISAFVRGEGRYQRARNRGGSQPLRFWFVHVTGYLTSNVYDERY